jgi:GT2 family glycosyltransferase
MSTLSVIIPLTRKNECREGLQALLSQEIKGHNLEIILISSEPDFFQELPYSSLVKIIYCKNPKAAYRRNMGASNAKGEYFAFIDDDTVVTPDWAFNMIKHLSENENTIVTGPNFDSRTAFKYRLANELQSHPLSEGLFSHREMKVDCQEKNFSTVILANMGVRRELFKRIGGFNEKADHYMDDTEFCYIAYKLKTRFVYFRDLAIQHNVRPVFFPFYRRQWHARFHAGMNTIIFTECYLRSFQVKGYALSLIILSSLIVFVPHFPWLVLFGAYGFLLALIGLSYSKKPILMICMPLCIGFMHLNGYLSFSLGIFYGFYARLIIYRKTILLKKARYKVFSEMRGFS